MVIIPLQKSILDLQAIYYLNWCGTLKLPSDSIGSPVSFLFPPIGRGVARLPSSRMMMSSLAMRAEMRVMWRRMREGPRGRKRDESSLKPLYPLLKGQRTKPLKVYVLVV